MTGSLSLALRSESDPRSAALLGGAAERLRERIAMRPHPAAARINRAYLERARQHMTRPAFEDAWSEGRGLTHEAVIGLASSPPDQRP
jgi:hypothetical protein